MALDKNELRRLARTSTVQTSLGPSQSPPRRQQSQPAATRSAAYSASYVGGARDFPHSYRNRDRPYKKARWLALLFLLMAAAAHQWWPGPATALLPSILTARDWVASQVQQALRATDLPPAEPRTAPADSGKPEADAAFRQPATAANAVDGNESRAPRPLLQRCADDELRLAAMRRMLRDAPETGAPWLVRLEEGFQRRCSRLRRSDAKLLQEVQQRSRSRLHLLEEDARLRVQVEQETARARSPAERRTRP